MNCDKETHWDTFGDRCAFCVLEERWVLGREYERERIIALLNEWGEANVNCYCCANDAAAYDLIALIKGENE